MEKEFAIIGSWNMKACDKGLSVYQRQEDSYVFLKRYFKEVNVGCQILKDDVVYFLDETKHLSKGSFGGGGRLLAARMDKSTGTLSLISQCKTFSTNPSFIAVDQERKYLVVVHHCSVNSITKLVRKPDGTIDNEILYDDVAIVMYKLNKDGSIDKACDYALHNKQGKLKYYEQYKGSHCNSHLHSVYFDRTDSVLIVSDKGQDKLYTYRIDKRKDKLVFLGETCAICNSDPRYGVFHPTRELFYGNHEKKVVLSIYRYIKEIGKIWRIQEVSLLENEKGKELAVASDLKISSKNYLYAAIRGIDMIAVVKIDDQGEAVLKQNISCGGKNPRGIEISADENQLFVANVDTDNVSIFLIMEDGTLRFSGEEIKVNCPSNIQFVEGE